MIACLSLDSRSSIKSATEPPTFMSTIPHKLAVKKGLITKQLIKELLKSLNQRWNNDDNISTFHILLHFLTWDDERERKRNKKKYKK